METKITALKIIKRFLKGKKYVQMWQIEVDCRGFGKSNYEVCHNPSTYRREFNKLVKVENYEPVDKDGRGKRFKHKTWLIN